VIGVLGAGAAAVLFLLCICVLWVAKSRHRHREKLHRRNSIRSSVRSTRSLASSFSDMSGGNGYRRRPNPNPMPEDGATGGSVDSMAKPPLDDTHSATTYDNSAFNDTHTTFAAESTSNFDDRFMHDPRLENANVDALVHPTYEMGYENRGYLDRSTFTSRNASPWTEPPDDSVGGATAAASQVELTDFEDSKPPIPGDESAGSDSTLDLKRPLDDDDDVSRASDQIPVYQDVPPQPPVAPPALAARSADPFPRHTPSVASDEYFQQGRTRSQPITQPLETAM